MVPEAPVSLSVPSEAENLLADYRHLKLTLRCHPLSLLREQLGARRFVSAAELKIAEHRTPIRTAGIVVGRQRRAAPELADVAIRPDDDGAPATRTRVTLG